MIKQALSLTLKKILLFYFFIFTRKLKFKYLSNLNFRIIDFNSYEKNKNIIYRKDFYKIDKKKIIHSFDFIYLCYKLGGKRGIELAKFGIFGWYQTNRFRSDIGWDNDTIANRILNLVYYYDFINSISTKSEGYNLKKILKINITAFNKFIFGKTISDYSLLDFKTQILIKYILDDTIIKVKEKFELILENQIDNFSMHKSYSLYEQAKFINDINEITLMLLNFKIEVPKIFEITRVKMETVLAQYFHKDGTIALFNGVSNSNLDKIKLTLTKRENLRKINFPHNLNGIYFFEDKNKKIFLDAIQPSNSSYSKKLSAGTLSFEFSSDKEKIITNCGALETTTGNAAYLRYSAAHSTIILENRNVSEIKENQPHIKYPQSVSFKKKQDNLKHSIEASHNGYIKNYKKIVKRKISFQENESYLIGEDSIISSISKNLEIVYHIRFHILPNINITQTNDKKSIILKTKNNMIWLFKANKKIIVEESVFIDRNFLKETKQIVIQGITKNNREKIEWSLTKK